MREITIYEANDGTRFENEDDCLEYEEQQKIPSYKEALDAFDWNCRYLDLSKLTLDFWANDATILRIKDPKKAKELFVYIRDMYGYDWPDNVEAGDIWIYDEVWRNLSREVEEKQKKLDMIRNLACE